MFQFVGCNVYPLVTLARGMEAKKTIHASQKTHGAENYTIKYSIYTN